MPALNALFDGLFAQHARLLEVKTALPEAALLVETFTGREAVSEGFCFSIDCVSSNAHFDLQTLIGEEITLRLLLADGSKRSWHGYVTEALQLGADGGFARYRLIMEPWLAFLDRRHNNYLFQDKTVTDILGQIFAGYSQASWTNQITQPLRNHSISTQYRETDLAFIRRLLAEEGLSYRFEHDQSAAAGDDTPHARHKLILFDREAELPTATQPVIRFHRSDATEASDTLQSWQEHRHVQSNAVALSGWDYKRLLATGATANSTFDNGELPALEHHDASLPYRFEDSNAAQLRTDLRLAAHESRMQRYKGNGTARQLAEGTVFTLSQHQDHTGETARFTVLAVEHHGANNLGSEAAKLLECRDIEAGAYRNHLLAQPAQQPLVPPPCKKPATRPQTALVVGLPDQALTTERDHRIKIQFHWQRGNVPNPGGLAATSGNAPGNDQSGTWVRVGEWLSGPNWGTHFLPRIGAEVLVDFVDGDIDRPIITGQAYNGADLPPYSAGHEANANHPGVLSGWMSHNFETGYNQWVLDDAPGQLRTRLASSENASQLGLGHLIHQSPDSATRGNWRGSGFELATGAWLAVRAGEGLLISATARSNSQGTQLDIAEAIGQLQAAEQTAKSLSDAAKAQNAAPLKANETQIKLIQSIDPKQDGKYQGDIGGQSARKAQPGSRELGDPVERFAQPLILAEAPADIGHASPDSVLVHAGGSLHATAQEDLHLASAHTIAAITGKDASLFSHAGGIKSVAQAGSHTLQAHTAPMEVLADQSMTVTSSNDEIHILAKSKIMLQAGQSSVTLQGQSITFTCPGTFSVKGAGQGFKGPGGGGAGLGALPVGTLAFILKDQVTAPETENPKVEIDRYLRGTGDVSNKWAVADLLKQLCPKDKNVVDDLANTDVLVADEIYYDDPYYDGTKWTTKRFDGAGSWDPNNKKLLLLSKGSPESGATTVYHELVHKHQDTGMPWKDMEIDAYYKTEQWTIERGQPGQAGDNLRSTQDGKMIPDPEKIQQYVEGNYPLPADSTRPFPVGRDAHGNTKLSDGTARPPQKGDTFAGPEITKPSPPKKIPRSAWKCDGKVK
ncbi:MAG: type VI secretion system tip protein VgrG [Zoogloeaceae bacterium]|jgi:type VI secretion system secreted protein VgrG|nr:type VI secretion system tip protein VgrG [Zoogloeaceae bacterium]